MLPVQAVVLCCTFTPANGDCAHLDVATMPPWAAPHNSAAVCSPFPVFLLKMQETFGAMAKTEKIAYILEQVRA
jgi:hypothetical protein